MHEQNQYSYELNPEMLKQLGEEFDVEKTTAAFAEQVKGKSADEIASEGRAFFEAYGTNWIRKALKLGEEYPDRTYEVLKMAIDKGDGYFKFALLPQRFIEIAYLSTQDIPVLPIIENNPERLIYRMVECNMFKGLKDKCGEDVAKQLPCQHACIAACKTIHKDLDIDANIDMEASIPVEGYCQFAARRA
ncbi:MAG: hypothetical protein V3S89_12235 [Desulfobacterales bacterium]